MEKRRKTIIALTEKQRTAIELASGRPGYGALTAGVLALLDYWQRTHPQPEPVEVGA